MTYELNEPEENAHIEVIENPEQVIRATYEAFKLLTRKYTEPECCEHEHWYGSDDDNHIVSRVYNMAIDLLRHASSLHWKAEHLEVLRPYAWHEDVTGVYVSALHNCSPLDKLVLEDFPRLAFPGYRLAQGKSLILKNNKACAGIESKGVIVNCSPMVDPSIDTEGVVVNFAQTSMRGDALIINLCNGDFDVSTYTGIVLNYGRVTGLGLHCGGELLANMSRVDSLMQQSDGVCLNLGHTDEMTLRAGVGINMHECRKLDESEVKALAVAINATGKRPTLRRAKRKNTALESRHDTGWTVGRPEPAGKSLLATLKGLADKVHEMDWLKRYNNKPQCAEELCDKLNSFDIAAWRSQIDTLAKHVKEKASESKK